MPSASVPDNVTVLAVSSLVDCALILASVGAEFVVVEPQEKSSIESNVMARYLLSFIRLKL